MIRISDLAARHTAVAADVEAAVLGVLRSGQYIGGEVVAEAEAAAARVFGHRGAVGVGSGTDALAIALQVAGVRPGDEVILPAWTFFATAGAVCLIGAIPVIVDVGPDGLLDVDAAAAAVGPRTRAIVPVHLFGALARAPDVGVPIVDDAAQAAGADPPRRCGAIAAASTYPTKAWASAGDGGFVLADDPDVLARARALGSHGLVGPHAHAHIDGVIGRNSRLDALHAAVLLAHLPALAARTARRRAIAAQYDAALGPGVRALTRDPGHPVSPYVLCCDDRAAVAARLRAAGVETAVYYPRPLGDQPALAAIARVTPCPVAHTLSAEALAVPCYDGLTEAEVATICLALSA